MKKQNDKLANELAAVEVMTSLLSPEERYGILTINDDHAYLEMLMDKYGLSETEARGLREDVRDVLQKNNRPQ